MWDFFKKLWEDKGVKLIVKGILAFIPISIVIFLVLIASGVHIKFGKFEANGVRKVMCDTIYEYVADTLNRNDSVNIQKLTKLQQTTTKTIASIQKEKPSQEQPRVQNNGNVKNQNNGVNNGIIGDITTDIPNPIFHSERIKDRVKTGEHYVTEIIVDIEYKGSLESFTAIVIPRNNVVDIDVAQYGGGTNNTSLLYYSGNNACKTLFQPNKKLRVTITTGDSNYFDLAWEYN